MPVLDAEAFEQACNRLNRGDFTKNDILLIQQAIKSGNLTLSSGEGSVAAGGDIIDSTVITGSNISVFLDSKASDNLIRAFSEFRPVSYIVDLPRPQSFDLDNLVCDGLNVILKAKNNLIGLAIPCTNQDFFSYFCDRLCQQMGTLYGRNAIDVMGSLPIRPRDFSPDEALQYVGATFLPELDRKDVIFYFQVADNETVELVWQYLCDDLSKTVLPRRLIAVIPYEPCENQHLTGVFLLDPPKFFVNDAINWVGKMIKCLEFPEELAQEWIELLTYKYKKNNEAISLEFDINKLYFHLGKMHRMIEQRRGSICPEELRKEFARIKER